MRNIRQHLVFAFICNGSSVPIAAGAFHSFLGILPPPFIAATAGATLGQYGQQRSAIAAAIALNAHVSRQSDLGEPHFSLT